MEFTANNTDQTKNDKFADEDELTFKHSSIRPNTWKPKYVCYSLSLSAFVFAFLLCALFLLLHLLIPSPPPPPSNHTSCTLPPSSLSFLTVTLNPPNLPFPSLPFFLPSPPSHRLRYQDEGDELVWVLPEDGLVLNKAYKIKWKLRVGRNVDSGDELSVRVSGMGFHSETLKVVVK